MGNILKIIGKVTQDPNDSERFVILEKDIQSIDGEDPTMFLEALQDLKSAINLAGEIEISNKRTS